MITLIKKPYDFVGKDKQKHSYYNFYIVGPNGYKVAVKPSFHDEYKMLCLLADTAPSNQ